MENQDHKLQISAEGEKKSETTITKKVKEKSTEIVENSETTGINKPEEVANKVEQIEDKKEKVPEAVQLIKPEKEAEPEKSTEKIEENTQVTPSLGVPLSEKEENDSKVANKKEEVPEEVVQDEIDQTNAEDAEDIDNEQRHHITILDYHSMSMENLVGELQRLVKNEKVQAIKKHVDSIKYEFDQKFNEFIEHKKDEFVDKGGNEIDFRYNSVTKRQFNEVYNEYREKKNAYYKSLEQNLNENLKIRHQLIEELKGLVNIEEDINTTYKNFKDIQERWRNTGSIPRNYYNDVWRTYHHHIEIFYDFLHLNRELRDLDFKHNYEEKLKLVIKAEALATEEDLNKAFRELQILHKVWKEDIGPVGKEHREEIWDRFSKATKIMHQRRQDHYAALEQTYEGNLIKKNEIIDNIRRISSQAVSGHKALQQQISEIEKQRDQFFKAGKVPQHLNEQTWASFKEAVRGFNKKKNAYYKNLKKEQQQNLDKKKALLSRALEIKDNEDWDTTTEEFKKIQREWKAIGHVPRKYSDSIWKEFKAACNHYFDRFHAVKNKAHKEESVNLQNKLACLEKLKSFKLSENKEKDIAQLKVLIEEWKASGRVPYHKKNINNKFNIILDAIFKKLDVSVQEAELLKYGDKLKKLAHSDNERALGNERTFVRRKIQESLSEIRQLENNLQFFSNASEENPIVKEVIKKIDRQKEALSTWKAKLKNLNIMQHNLNKEHEEKNEEVTPDTPEENAS